MTRKKVSVRKAAVIAGVGSSTVNSWRSGSAPTDYLAVKRLAEHLGVSMAFLLTGEEDAVSLRSPPQIEEVFEDGGELFDGFAQISIRRLIPRGSRRGVHS